MSLHRSTGERAWAGHFDLPPTAAAAFGLAHPAACQPLTRRPNTPRKALEKKLLRAIAGPAIRPRQIGRGQRADSLQEYALLDQPEGQMVRYPQIRIELRTRNPLVLVAAVRQELRRAGVDKDEIQRFSEEALAGKDLQKAREVCETWVATGHRGE